MCGFEVKENLISDHSIVFVCHNREIAILGARDLSAGTLGDRWP